MGRIRQETIDQIRDTADILDVVSDYVDLRKRGRNFFGLCPFHPETTPSFSVAPDKQIFHCFGCGTGGNVITFLMEYEKVSFVEALQKLARRTGVKVVMEEGGPGTKFTSGLYRIHELAMALYQKNLKSDAGKKVRTYLKEERGLTDQTLEKFSIGLSLESWDQLLELARSKKASEDIIEKSGLFTRTQKGIFDRFRTRLMFPIANRAGRVVAFAGRDLEGTSQAKYLNSPETPVYNKSEILYGLSQAKDAIRKSGSVVVVEGYMDVLQLVQNGIQNVVATSGTAFTETHVTEIRKVTDTVYLAYDGDMAGRKAAVSAGYHVLRGGLIPEVVTIPDGSDPDSWVREEGPDALLNSIKGSSDLLDYHFAHTAYDLTKPTRRSQLAREILAELKGIPDEIVRRHTVKKLAEMLDVGDDVLMRMMARDLRGFYPTLSSTPRVREDPSTEGKDRWEVTSSTDRAQMEIVSLLAAGDPSTVVLLTQNLNLDHFSNPVMKSLVRYLIPRIEHSSKAGSDLSGALDQFQKKSDRDLASKVLYEAVPHSDPHRVAVDCLITLEQTQLKRDLVEQRVRLRDLEKNGSDSSSALTDFVKLQEQLQALEQKRTELLNLR
ncbi:MAG: DNA primase [Fidelibacterota bacterium]